MSSPYPQFSAQYPPPPPPGPSGPHPGTGASGGGSRLWMVPAAAGLGVVLLGSTVWASVAVVDDLFGGPQPEEVFPASAAAFAKLDLKPSATQLADYAEFVNRMPDSLRDELGEDGEPAADFFTGTYEYLDYEEDVEPWLGQRFAVGMWPTEDAMTAQEHGAGLAAGVAVEDESAAAETLEEIATNEDDFHYQFRGDFAVIVPTAEMFDEFDSEVDSAGVLADEERFAEDMTRIGDDALASGWLDVGEMGPILDEWMFGMRPPGGDPFGADPFEDDPFEDDPFEDDPFEDDPFDDDPFDDDPFDEDPFGDDPFDEDPFGDAAWSAPADEPYDPSANLGGRVAMALHIEGDHLEFRSDLIEFTVEDFASSELQDASRGVDSLADLPEDSVMAVGGSGLDELATRFWEDNPELFQDDRGTAGLDGWMEEYGVSLPEDFTRLLGEETVLGITDLGDSGDIAHAPGPNEDPTFQLRADNADAELLQELIDAEVSGSTNPEVTSDDEAAVVELGEVGGGELRDAYMFDTVTDGLDDAVGGMYVDLVTLSHEDGSEDAEEMGVLGGILTHDEAAETSSVAVRWAPTGG